MSIDVGFFWAFHLVKNYQKIKSLKNPITPMLEMNADGHRVTTQLCGTIIIKYIPSKCQYAMQYILASMVSEMIITV